MSSGGKREGAGRPRKDYKKLSVEVPEEVAVEVKRRAVEQKKSQGEVVAEAIKKTKG